ncbi:hypothetical protein C8R46DRAFT_1191395 [Mycena filopes]|nr:hypothetical protein C8R46DRAFT_1191395 [Mycena filopes]
MSSTSESAAPCVRCGFPTPMPRMTIVEPIHVPAPDEFMRSNDLPPDSVIAWAHREMAVAETGIGLVEEKMAHLKQLREQGLRDFVADHQRIVAPIRRLPTELLAEIFSQAVSSDSSSDWNPTTNAGWILARVSRAWRAVLTSMPQIWSRITVFDRSTPRPKDIELKEAILLQLERSTPAPLTIRFKWPGFSSEQRISVLEALFSAKDRWQDVDIFLNKSEFRHFPASSFPMLTKLRLSVTSWLHKCDFATVFKTTPALQDLHYHGQTGDSQTALSRMLVFPLAQLKRLRLSSFDCDLSHLLAVFKLASNIVELRIDHCSIHADVQGSNRQTLPNLVFLEVSNRADTFVQCLDVPILQRLTINLSDDGDIGISA